MDGHRGCHTEWRKSDREEDISYDIPYMWILKKNDTNELTKQKEAHRLREWIYGCLLYLKWKTNKDLPFSKRDSAQCYVAAWTGGSLGENGYMNMYDWVPSQFTWNYHNIVNWLCPIQNKKAFLKKCRRLRKEWKIIFILVETRGAFKA